MGRQPQVVLHLLLGVLGVNLVVPDGFSGPENFVFALTTFSQFTALGESLEGPYKDLNRTLKRTL